MHPALVAAIVLGLGYLGSMIGAGICGSITESRAKKKKDAETKLPPSSSETKSS